jgi:DNA polymerase
MSKTLRSELIKALKDQKEVFGDELFMSGMLQSKIVTEKVMSKKAQEDLELFSESKESWETTDNLQDLDRLICNCTKCDLHKGRNKFVFGVGNLKADVVLIGEGPGAEEDKQGEPFVGRAGQLLNDILKAINFTRQEVYIANIVKCRPPGNRTPLPEEMDSCLPYLLKQIELIKPKLILCLGLVAAGALLKKKDALGKLRGKIFEFNNTKVMVTYHPAALLRNPNFKRDCWVDVKAFRKLYDEVK